MTTKLQHRAYVRRMESLLLDPPTADEVEAAERWYDDAREHADVLASKVEGTTEIGACILSAMSIRTTWSKNLEDAYDYADGNVVRGLKVRNTLADAALVHGFKAFKAPKTYNFARAIAGDEDAVVVDSWMCKAARLDRDAPTAVQYREISKAVRVLAKRYKMTPRGMQALIWGRVRGSLV